jgi:2,4-dienoyl-CoA reductase-like NADH-dependent reductase (Old Yellow Enzyme family)/thioredoxin reductase
MSNHKYPSLLSPITVNGVTLRNRIIATCSCPHFVQGSETWPTDGLIMHYANKARGGAAIVTCKANQPKVVIDPHDQNLDITIPANQHYFAQMAEAVHYYGAKASMLAQPPITLTEGWDASTGMPSEFVEGDGSVMKLGMEAPEDVLEKVADAYAEHVYIAKGLGFDGCFIHMAYRLMFPGRFLSPYTNRRTDMYGGDVHGRAQFPLMIARKIKEACGEGFFIEISCSGEEPELDPGVRIADTVQLAKEVEGFIDFLQIRGTFIDVSQATYLDPRRLPHLEATAQIAQAVHEQGIQTKITLIGGCQRPDLLDDIVARGDADMIGAARGFLSDPEWVNKAYEGRPDEITPCLRCNKCHQVKTGDWVSTCSVNPIYGIEHKVGLIHAPLTPRKKVAVVGGGPAGMYVAVESAKRGHDVTMYEQAGTLGGLLNVASIPDIKWTLKEWRDFMVHMVEKTGVNVLLNTKATPAMIDAGGYDVVVAATGSEPVIPPIPGVDKAVTVLNALRDHSTLHPNVVVVGGGEMGVETGIHLARNGHRVVLLEMLDVLAPGCVPIHFRKLFRDLWESTPGFSYHLRSRCTAIEDGVVRYVDGNGDQQTIDAGSVVLAVGLKSRREEALAFYGSAPRLHLIGDCETVGSIRECTRSGYAIARML